MASVYELTAGTALALAEGYCRHLTEGGTFSASSQPTKTWVEAQLDLDAAYIATKLEECGYAAAQTGTSVVQILQSWNTIRTVVAIELANPIESISGRGNPRFQEFLNRAKALQAIACGPGLADIGATVSGGLSDLLTPTGISKDRKKTVEDDDDHIKHRIRRGQFTYPGASLPHAETDDVIT